MENKQLLLYALQFCSVVDTLVPWLQFEEHSRKGVPHPEDVVGENPQANTKFAYLIIFWMY